MQNYNFYQKFLHKILLSNQLIKKGLYEIEKIFFLEKEFDLTKEEHIFISGLPRSGTTILLNYLYNTKIFASLLYKDMPFVMAPNLFSKLNYTKNLNEKERYHKDGIYINLESPEALDEIFLSTFTENEIENEIENYISLILKKNKKKRYLSKNNSNYNRINLLQKKFRNALFVIPFREPIQHSNSLFNQHLNFIDFQNENKFILNYMNYLGHYEFGNNHKSWNNPKKFFDFLDFNYWLEQWCLFYENILNNFKGKKNLYFLCYENLKDENYKNQFNKFLNINAAKEFNFKNNLKKVSHINIDNNLNIKSKKIYENLNNFSLLKIVNKN